MERYLKRLEARAAAVGGHVVVRLHRKSRVALRRPEGASVFALREKRSVCVPQQKNVWIKKDICEMMNHVGDREAGAVWRVNQVRQKERDLLISPQLSICRRFQMKRLDKFIEILILSSTPTFFSFLCFRRGNETQTAVKYEPSPCERLHTRPRRRQVGWIARLDPACRRSSWEWTTDTEMETLQVLIPVNDPIKFVNSPKLMKWMQTCCTWRTLQRK